MSCTLGNFNTKIAFLIDFLNIAGFLNFLHKGFETKKSSDLTNDVHYNRLKYASNRQRSKSGKLTSTSNKTKRAFLPNLQISQIGWKREPLSPSQSLAAYDSLSIKKAWFCGSFADMRKKRQISLIALGHVSWLKESCYNISIPSHLLWH